MKRFLTSLAALFIAISAIAQMPQKLPLDAKVRSGVLENGLTYFIVQNNEPKGQAEFYIAQKVGSILEEENQRGLAHFLEHMAFNGTENFPGNGVISYLETIGVKFGANLNAYTSFDQTVYNISNVPVKRQGIIDSCMLILRDWACAISLTDKDIDEERGVIREEFRTSSSAFLRMYEKVFPEIMPDSRYAHRLPIGLIDVINNFSYKELRDYYHKWYRPDNQGIIIVGDIDPDAIENQIKTLFGAIPKPENPAERIQLPVPDTKEPVIGIASDREASTTEIMLMYKHDVLPVEMRGTAVGIIMEFMNGVVSNMLSARLNEIAQKPDSPFTSAYAGYGGFIVAQTKDALSFSASAKEGKIKEALTVLTNEAERVKRHGFTASEYERAKATYMSRLEQTYNEREKQKNSYYVSNVLNHFLTGEAYPGIETQYAMMQQVTPNIPIDQINQYAKSLPRDENIAIAVMMPDKDGLAKPTKEEILATFTSAKAEEVTAYEETVSNEPLVPIAPAAGKVLSELKEPMSNSIVWNLSNGATVVIKKTDFKEDQIVFAATSKGGLSLIEKDNIINAKDLTTVATSGGLGKYNVTDLRKVLAGKNVSVRPNIAIQSESINGSSTPKDIETFMQLLYLNFTDVREDQDAFKAYVGRMRAQIENMEAQPMVAFSDTLTKVLYNNNPYANRMTLEMLDKIDYAKALELYRERFANAADFVFTFVGNVDENILKPLVETYIASLPSNKSQKENWANVGLTPVKGKVVNHFEKEMQTPKATVYTIFSGKLPYTIENTILASMTKQVFDLVFTRSIREDEGGTYGVGVNMSVDYYPEDSFMFLFGFDTDVALRERLLNRAHKEIAGIMESGVSAEDFSKIMEYMQKTYTQNLRENGYWLGIINTRFMLGKDMHSTYESVLKGITPEKVTNFIKQTLTQGNQIEVVMNGKAADVK
ncbi:MAG: insulinase family protein [Bacteroidales bacterium]|nr:insulinase family protein [Bacteroidales bacterium]